MPLYTAPSFNQKLLNSTTVLPKTPLAILAVATQKNLNSEEILNNAGACVSPQIDVNGTRLQPQGKKWHIQHAHNFSLKVTKDLLNQYGSITISNCKNFKIESETSILNLRGLNKFVLSCKNCSTFSITNLSTNGGRNIIAISESQDFTIQGCQGRNGEGNGIIIHNSRKFTIKNCSYLSNQSAGIFILGDSSKGYIDTCQCKQSYGFLNQDAGIHLCATSPNITMQQVPENCHEALSITEKTSRPQQIVIQNCVLSDCRAQGIYLEGASNCLIGHNLITNNNKEGVCFDWGSCYNIFINNMVAANGERNNLTKEEIKIDFITKFPLLDDHSSSMKLPGMSIDNGCMNLVKSNSFIANFGGGLKLIRSSFFNTIEHNKILHNAIGKNEFVPCFHGISALGVEAVNNEFDGERSNLLDFYPSIFNLFAHNFIQGHWDSIFVANNSKNNTLVKNIKTLPYTEPPPPLRLVHRIKAFLKRKLRVFSSM